MREQSESAVGHDLGKRHGRIEMSERQRERFDRIREECKNDHVPAPDDEQMMNSLMDTWDAVADGFYSDDHRSDRGGSRE